MLFKTIYVVDGLTHHEIHGDFLFMMKLRIINVQSHFYYNEISLTICCFYAVDPKTQKITLEALVAHLQAKKVEYQVFSIHADYQYS